jgi:cold-shock DEAD box protein A
VLLTEVSKEENMKFNELGLDSALLESIEKMGFEEATPIQAQTIPKALAGLDVIGQAQTGTGKTAAFGLPMLQKIDPSKKGVQGLVIAPTRELAIQTQEELFRLGRDKKIRVQAVYGGADINRQIRQLKENPQNRCGNSRSFIRPHFTPYIEACDSGNTCLRRSG